MWIINKLFKNKVFLLGFVTFSLIFLSSVLHGVFFNDVIPTSGLLYNEEGRPLPAPYSGEVYPPWGTDSFGRNIFFVMLMGAKYTILAGIIITFLRIFPSLLFALSINYILYKFEKPIKSIADSINYFPSTLIAFLILNPLSYTGYDTLPTNELVKLIIVFIIVVSAIGIPTNTVLISNEIKFIRKMEFIQSSKVLGASNRQLFIKHVTPFLVPQLFIVSIREFIQSLILMSHLGVLGVFIGGFYYRQDLFGVNQPTSISNEWTGLLGMWWDYVYTTYPWVAFIPILGFTIVIIAAKCMLEGLKKVLESRESEIKVKKHDSITNFDITLPPFELLRKRSLR